MLTKRRGCPSESIDTQGQACPARISDGLLGSGSMCGPPSDLAPFTFTLFSQVPVSLLQALVLNFPDCKRG